MNTFTNVTDFLLAGKDPSRIALQFLRQDVSYGELRRAIDETAKSILQLGGKKGEPVILIGDNSFFWVATYLGILRAGLVCVPLSTSVSTRDLKYVLDNTQARTVFAQRAFVRREQANLESIRVITDGDVPGATSIIAFPSTVPDDLAALMFTSGSTGTPRGVMVSHRNIMANTESIIRCLQLTQRDRIMAVLPFYYCFGTSLLHTHLKVGGSVVVDTRFMYPEVVLQRMIDTECTGFAGVPSHFQILLRNSSLALKSFPHLRYVQQAGGNLAPVFIRELREVLPAKQIFIMYGQTEATARLSYLPQEFLESKLGSIGRGMPGVLLRVLNEFGEDVRPGEVGEIVASGDNIAHGYWQDSEESARTFREGALYTGDLATVDEDGFIYVVDRAKDFLKCGGERVSCRQLEEQLLAFEELLEVAVVGVPHDVLGESVKAYVVPRAAANTGLSDRLIQFCKTFMPPQLIPREIILMDCLPKNGAGKVLKAVLRNSNGSGTQ